LELIRRLAEDDKEGLMANKVLSIKKRKSISIEFLVGLGIIMEYFL
jgi:hypothetical protein